MNFSQRLRTCIALLPGICILAASSTAFAADVVRTVSVSGAGEVQAEPDRATVTLGIEARKLKLDEARDAVTRSLEAVLKLTRDLKIDSKFVRATRVNVQPEYNWNAQNASRNLIGYSVSRQVEIDLRELDKLGSLLERALDLGVNQLGDPQLDSTRRQDLQREALAKAVADARLNAETLAKAASVKLGAVRTLSATANASPPIALPRVMSMKAQQTSEAASTFQSGQLNFTANVQAEYELLMP